MAKFEPTPAQRQAIELRDRPVLVSAAAGSGKTRVLTERLMARILEGEDIRRFLVITFTRAAAAELRGRILTELNARIAENPGDARLRKQSAYLYRAQIGTIDSFCGTVVREYAHVLGVSPDFATLDEERSSALRSRALEDVLDRAYEGVGENEGLRLLIDTVGAGRDDARLARLVLTVHNELRTRVWPEKWAREQLAALDAEGVEDAGRTVWGQSLLREAAEEADFHARALEECVSAMSAPPNEAFFGGYIAPFAEAALRHRDISRAAGEGWDRARSFTEAPWPSLTRVKKGADESLRRRAKDSWDAAKKSAEKLRKLLAGESAALLEDIRRTRPALEALMELVFALDREYAARKRRADACDFADLERFCVRLLCEEEAGGPTPLAGVLSERFAEVMVDEYQDVNEVQEIIFRRVSGEGRRLFMVGDVKQSIYRFRLAEPEIFNRKLRAFAEDPEAGRVLLRENFRSRDAVIDACNAVFSRIMSPALGDIEYDDEAALVRGSLEYGPEGEIPAELCVLDPGGPDGEEETPDKRLAEARYVAARIRAMVERGEPVSDGAGGLRPVRYGDIAVLMRTPGTSGGAFRRALTEAGVPVCARQGGAFFSGPEVSFALSMLAVADNPRQDVPLVAALRGLPFGFTPDELSAVRAARKDCDLWDALCLRAEEDGRSARFVGLVGQLRELAREEPTESVLRWLYDRTGLLAACAVLPDAGARTARLMQLYEYARRFEEGGSRGLFRFLGWLRSLEEKGMEPPAAVNADSVQLLSIHKSKGLEYPVVFLADNAHRWAGGGGEQVLCHSRLGLGMRMTDAARGVAWPTLAWRAIDRQIRREELSEQERVLYVAMTRARERLIMTCVQTNAEKYLESLPAGGDGPIEPRLLLGASSAAAWLMRAAAADAGRTINMRVVHPLRTEEDGAEKDAAPLSADPAMTEALAERLSWRYPGAGAVTLPSKLTATGAVRAMEARDPEARDLEPARERLFRMPDLARGDAPLTGAERGTAAHLVMQHIDYARTGSAEEIRAELERLRRQGFLTDKQAAAVPPGDILAFFRSDIGRRVKAAERPLREFRFSVLCPAKEWFPDSPPEEEILLQGVVDCCFVEDGAVTIVDFKTDAEVEPERHRPQLRAYAAAMGRILGLPVRRAELWYLRRREAAELLLSE